MDAFKEPFGLPSATFSSGVGADGFAAFFALGLGLLPTGALVEAVALASAAPFVGTAAFGEETGFAAGAPFAAGFGDEAVAVAFVVDLGVAFDAEAAFGTGFAALGAGLAAFAADFTAGLAAAGRTDCLPGEALGLLLIWMPAGSGPGPWRSAENYTGNKGF